MRAFFRRRFRLNQYVNVIDKLFVLSSNVSLMRVNVLAVVMRNCAVATFVVTLDVFLYVLISVTSAVEAVSASTTYVVVKVPSGVVFALLV